MKIRYDQKADALYIHLNDGNFVENKEVEKDVVLDLGKDRALLGIEILNVSEKLPPEKLSHVDIQLGSLAPAAALAA